MMLNKKIRRMHLKVKCKTMMINCLIASLIHEYNNARSIYWKCNVTICNNQQSFRSREEGESNQKEANGISLVCDNGI